MQHRTRKGLVVATGAVAALLSPLALAAPAQASTTKDGCTLSTPARPYHSGTINASGDDLLHRKVTFTCDAGRSVAYESTFYEQDFVNTAGDGNPNEDLIGTYSDSMTSFLTASGRTSQTVTLERALGVVPDETDTTGEFYQTVRFRVTSNGVQGSWSTAEFSAVHSISL